MVPDEPVVDLDDAGAALVHDELGVTGPEPDSQSFQLAQYLWRLRGGAVHSRRSSTKKGGGESVVRNDPSTRSSRPSPSVSRVWRCPGRYSSATRGSLRRAAISSTRAASSPASCTRNTSSLATPSRGLTTSGKGASAGTWKASAEKTGSMDARCRRRSALFFARVAARQSLAGSPKYAAARAAGAWRKSLLEKTAAGSPSMRAMMSRKSETSHSTIAPPNGWAPGRSVRSVTSRPRRAAAGRNPCVTESVALPATR